MGPDGIRIAGMNYKALIVEFDPPSKAKESLEVLKRAGRVIRWGKDDGETLLLQKINSLISMDVSITPDIPDLRVRHVLKDTVHYYIVFNEGQEHSTFRLITSTKGQRFLIDPQTGRQNTIDSDALLQMQPHELKVLKIANS